MNLLDIRTLVISQLVTDLQCTGVLLYLWRANRGRHAGTGLWVADFSL